MDSIADIEHAMTFIPADDRDTWLRVGMAVKSELGDQGFSLWDYWSRGASNYKERDCRDVWRSIKGSGIDIGTLFHEAQQNGWRKNAAYTPVPIPKKSPPPQPQSPTGDYARSLWANGACGTTGSHPYAISKDINWDAGAKRGAASGRVIGRSADCVIIPYRNVATNAVCAVECINPDGNKQTFGTRSGCAFICGNTLDKSLHWFIVEGWADAVSLCFHTHKGNAAVFAAGGKGAAMDALAEKIAEAFSPDRLIVVEDAA